MQKCPNIFLRYFIDVDTKGFLQFSFLVKSLLSGTELIHNVFVEENALSKITCFFKENACSKINCTVEEMPAPRVLCGKNSCGKSSCLWKKCPQ